MGWWGYCHLCLPTQFLAPPLMFSVRHEYSCLWSLRLDSDIRSEFFMHIYNPQEYPNLLQAILLTSEEIKNSVSTDKLIFLRERNKEVEWGIKLPMFVDAFYDYIVKTQTIPNQKDFLITIYYTTKISL